MVNVKNMRVFIIVLILIFPVASNLVTHAGSVILVLLTLTGLLTSVSSKNRPPLSKEEKWMMWAFIAYFGIYLLSFSLNGLLGNLEDPRLRHLDQRIRMLFMVPIFLLLRRIQVPQWALWYSVTMGAIIAGIYAMLHSFWLDPGIRVAGSYHAIAFGDLAIVLAFMSVPALNYFTQKHKVYALIPLTAVLLGTAASILSGTRGSWIALPAFTLLVFFYLGKFIKLIPRILTLFVICIVFFSLYKVPSTQIANRIQLVFTEMTDYFQGNIKQTSTHERISTHERLETWLAALAIFKQHAIIGAGPGSFATLLRKMIAEGKRSEIVSRYNRPPNAYLAAMADCGFLGLLALLGILGLPLWLMISYIRQDGMIRDLAYAGIVLVIGFSHFGLTECIFGRNVNISFYLIMLATILSIASNERYSPTSTYA